MDKTGRKVLCGHQRHCQQPLAAIVDSPGHVLRVVSLGAGWRRNKDGVWQLSRYNRRRRQRAFDAFNRGRLTAEQRAQQSRPKTPHPFESEGELVHSTQVPPLPATVACPRCNRHSLLDAMALGGGFANPATATDTRSKAELEAEHEQSRLRLREVIRGAFEEE